jgi:CHAT domain-containing protein/Tfp pilus assembly protein PilF
MPQPSFHFSIANRTRLVRVDASEATFEVPAGHRYKRGVIGMVKMIALAGALISLFGLWPARALALSLQQAETLYNKGMEIQIKASSKQDLEKALRMFNEALPVFERHNAEMWRGATLSRMGMIFYTWGDASKGLDHFEKALSIANRIGFAKLQVGALNEIAGVYYERGEFKTALESFENMLEICRKKPELLEAVYLYNIGAVYEMWGQYRKALEYYEQCFATAKKLRDLRGQGLALKGMANVYQSWGQSDRAMEKLQAALDIFRKNRNAESEGTTLIGLGTLYAAQGQIEKGMNYLQQNLELLNKMGIPTDYTKSRIGELYLQMGQIDLAEPYIRETNYLAPLGRLSLAKGEYQQAKKYYEELLEASEESNRVDNKFVAYTGLAKAHEALEDYKKAEEYYEKGMKLTEEIRSGLMPAERKNFFEVKERGFARSEPAQGLTRVRMKLNRAAQSIDSSEVTRARTFSDNIAQKSEGGYAGMPKVLLEKEDALVTKVASLKKELGKTQKDLNPDRYNSLSREIQKAEDELNLFIEMLWQKHKAYASVKYPRPVALKESATRPDEHILIFDVVSEGVGVKLIKGKEIAQTYYVKWSLVDLENDVRRFRLPLEKLKPREFDPELGYRLYRRLISSALSEVPEGSPLVIIPDGILALLPFEALITSGKPVWKTGKYGESPEGLTYLSDVYPISYYQSITAMTLVRTLGKREKTGDKTLAIVDPVYSLEDDRVKKVSAEKRQAMLDKLTGERLMSAKTQLSGLEFLRLPLTAQLGESLKKSDPEKTDLFEGFHARKSVLLQKDLTEYRSIVFGTHGYFGTDLPMIQEPVLILTLLDQPKGQDGFLRLTEVMSLKMNCDIVALTACQSGLGKQISGEGTMGMGRAFQYAGAKSVLMSLWSVAESSSVDLVTSFFKYLREGKNKLEALKLAREEIRKAGYDHPFFWAPFILVGETD